MKTTCSVQPRLLSPAALIIEMVGFAGMPMTSLVLNKDEVADLQRTLTKLWKEMT